MSKLKKKKILMIFGTRPEAIKMAPLYHELKKHKNNISLKVCVSAQHRELLDQVLKFFDIKVDFDLDIMKKNQELSDLTSSLISKISLVLKKMNPDLVLVHGDTTTAFSAALAAFYKNIKIGHVEAGLRTYDNERPFPEEINRQIVSKISRWHFSPTENSFKNLLRENIQKKNIVKSGNTVIDALFLGLENIKSNHKLRKKIQLFYKKILPIDLDKEKVILLTNHRRENLGIAFDNIFSALLELSREFKDYNFVYPMHLNPKVKRQAMRALSNVKNIHLISPLNYPNFLYLMNKSHFIITDSGGIQEEAPSLGKPVLVTRDKTERPEAVEKGAVKLVGSNPKKIIKMSSMLIKNKEYYNSMSQTINPYGDGKASFRITKFIIKNLNEL